MTRYYFGGAYEETGTSVTKYYSIAGQTVAMRTIDTSHVGTILQTDFGYTFQRDLGGDVGLMNYKARFYVDYIELAQSYQAE